MDFAVLMYYLIYGLSVYTLKQSRSYKILEAHMQFTDGWVDDLKMYVPENCDNTVIKAKVRTVDLLGHVHQHGFVWPVILICKIYLAYI